MINDWEKLSRIFDRVLTLPPEGRTACIHELCEGNPGLEKKVQELLSGLESTTELLELYTEKNQALLEEMRSEERRVGKEGRALEEIRNGHVTGVQTCALPILGKTEQDF